jgi:hypothetical protein
MKNMKTLTDEQFEKIRMAINSTNLCLMAHPDNEPDSEFADRIYDLQECQSILKSIEHKEV